MTPTRTLADIDRDLDATVAAWQEAEKIARRHRVAARKAGEAGGKDSVIHAANLAAAAEAECSEYEALRDALALERATLLRDNPAVRAAHAAELAARVAADEAEHGDPFDIPGGF